jgi:DNA-binding CsgD family transcriptional regulator
MILEKYTELHNELIAECNVPKDFFQQGADEKDYCLFFVSCLQNDKFLYFDESFQSLTGYPNEDFIKGGMDFWLPLICPQDMDEVTQRIIDIHKAMSEKGFDTANPEPLVMEYRLKHAAGHWIKIRDKRYIVSFSEGRVIAKSLCRFAILEQERPDKDSLNSLLNSKDKKNSRLLEVAVEYQNSKNKQNFNLTKKEKEIVRFIAQGLSTKMIADQCFISIHTVETHRRHLLQKLQVKNSMELVKEVSKHYSF